MDFDPLWSVAQAQYEQERRSFAQILLEERRLRAEVQRISDLDTPLMQTPETLGDMRAIGADVLWRGWLSRSKSAINQDLARILARKTRHQDQVRRAFGKLKAIEKLIADAKSENTRHLTKQRMTATMDQLACSSLEISNLDGQSPE
ncbi:MAG: hypothetical protein AAF943_01080 [Pseudomonadota bacterium]